MYKKTSYSIEETKVFAKFVLNKIFETKTNSAKVLILRGDLGAGKTAFTKCIGEILGVKEEITSPTFNLEKRYNIEKKEGLFSGIETLIHIDAFRLESGRELFSIGFEETIKNPKNLICFEWPEMVDDIDLLPVDAPVVDFEFIDENTREMYFSPTQDEGGREVAVSV